MYNSYRTYGIALADFSAEVPLIGPCQPHCVNKLTIPVIAPKMGQTTYYRIERCNCTDDQKGTCWYDCYFTNYFYGADDTKVPDIQLHCILYLEYYNSETSIFA